MYARIVWKLPDFILCTLMCLELPSFFNYLQFLAGCATVPFFAPSPDEMQKELLHRVLRVEIVWELPLFASCTLKCLELSPFHLTVCSDLSPLAMSSQVSLSCGEVILLCYASWHDAEVGPFMLCPLVCQELSPFSLIPHHRSGTLAVCITLPFFIWVSMTCQGSCSPSHHEHWHDVKVASPPSCHKH